MYCLSVSFDFRRLECCQVRVAGLSGGAKPSANGKALMSSDKLRDFMQAMLLQVRYLHAIYVNLLICVSCLDG